MLNIYLGDMENAIYHPPVYFDNTYEDEWITDELCVNMIKYIDKSDYSRKSYYEVISNRTWGDKSNYDLCLDCKLGNETIKNLICNYVKSINE